MILTSYPSATASTLIEKLRTKGVRKVVEFERPLELARQHHANDFTAAARDLHETDALRVLDFDGQDAFQVSGVGPEDDREIATRGGLLQVAAPTTVTSMRRFWSRPAAVSLVATGWVSP